MGVRYGRLFQSDMRLVVDYLAEGNSFCSDRPVVHKEALIRLLRALGGDRNVEDTAVILEEMDINEEDELTMCELFDQYTRKGRLEGIRETLIKNVEGAMKNFGLDLAQACAGLEVSVEEYTLAKRQAGAGFHPLSDV